MPNRLAADTPPDLDLKVTPVLGRGFGESFHWQLGVTAPDGALYVTLNNAQRVNPPPGVPHDAAGFELSVGQIRQGRVPVPMTVMDDRGQPLRVRVAHTPTDFFAATRRGEAAFLVYRLEPGRDLRRPGLTQVSPAQVRVTVPEVP